MWLFRISLVVFGAFLLAGVAAQQAEARELRVEDFHAEINVAEDGSVSVEERIRVRFRGAWNGIFRFIPYRYQLPTGVRGSIRLKIDAVEDDQGNPLEHKKRKWAGNVELKIRVPGASDAVRTVVIRYHAADVIRLYDEEDEDYGARDQLYWNVTGLGWQMPIDRASATVTLPPDVPKDKIRTQVHVGRYRSVGVGGRATTDLDALRFETTQTLAPNEGLTIVIGFPPGHVQHPTSWTRVRWFIVDNFHLGLPLLALLLWWFFWFKLGRDDLSKHTIIPEFEAPLGLRPAEVGILADDSLDQRDLTASIVDLAVRGLITIEYRGKEESTRLHLHREKLAAANLSRFEDRLVDALFGDSGTEREMSELKYKFYKRIGSIRKAAIGGIIEKGLFHRNPSSVRAVWTLLTFAVLGVLTATAIALSWPPIYFFVLIACAIPMFFLARHMPQRTKKGIDALARVRGLEDYLVTAEEQRMRSLPMETLEALIPYALALGVADKWIDTFTAIYAEQPQWAQSSAGWNPAMMGRMMNGMRSDVGSNLYSGPRASSSSSSGGWSGGSGFSGGGFSGGGFGGGGGGGW